MKVYIKLVKGSSVKEIRSLKDNTLLKKFISKNTAALWIYNNRHELVKKGA